MGLALAEAASRRGWPTTLLLGPAPIAPPEDSHVRTIRFQTTADLQSLLRLNWPQHDVLFMAAAVADYRAKAGGTDPAQPALKIPRRDQPLTLELEPTPDLLADLSSITKPHQTVIGFALEPAARLLTSAREKLTRKKLHAIVANPLETMDAEQVTATVLLRDGRQFAAGPDLPKREFARWLLTVMEPTLRAAGQAVC